MQYSMAAPWVTRFCQGFVWLFPIEVTEIYYAGKLHQLYNKSLSSLSHHLLSFLHGAHTGHSTYTVALVSPQLVKFVSKTAFFFFYVNCLCIEVLVKYSTLKDGLVKMLVHFICTARSIETVPRGGPPIFRLMLMNSRGGPPILGLYVDEF